MKTSTLRNITALILASTLLAACSALSPKPSAWSDEEVLTATESLLTALNEDDYETFVQDFGPEMLDAFGKTEYADLRQLVTSSSGNFVTCQEPNLLNQQGFAIYRLACEFDLEEVTTTVVMAIDGETIDGLYFTSPNIRSNSDQ